MALKEKKNMAITSMVRILASVAMIVFAGAVTVSATGAFFSDTEVSEGNMFTAGAIDLRIDNESYVTDATGILAASPATSWVLSDLTDQLFFSFSDLKPGGFGEDTISIHAGTNDAWACMAVDITATPENGQTEPEASEDATAGPDQGELQDDLEFVFWLDDGDNVLETDEVSNILTSLSGPAGTVFTGDWQPIADSQNGTAIVADDTRFVGKAWCFGTLTNNAVAPGDLDPLVNGTGFDCDGSAVRNAAQTDGVVADVMFHATQTRNNGDFLCSSLNTP